MEESLLPRRLGGSCGAGSGVTGILVLSTFVAACLSFDYGCIVGYTAPTQSAIMEDLGLSVKEFSLFGSILTIGAMLGALVNGKITDLLGRKNSMWLVNLLSIVGWLTIAFAQAPWMLDLGRFLLGVITGVTVYLAPIYVAEITPKDIRGRFTAVVPMMIIWGISFMDLVGPFVNWRILAIIGAVPNLLSLPFLFFAPESPRWLAKVGLDKEFEATLLRFRGEKFDSISQEVTDIKEFTEYTKNISSGTISDLFQAKYGRPLVIAIGLFTLQNLGGMNGYIYYSSVILTSAGVSSLLGLVILAVIQILVGVLSTLLIDKSGRRGLLLVSAAGLWFGSTLTGVSFLLQDMDCWAKGTPILALISVLIYMGFNVLGMGGIPALIVAEIFPMNVKGLAGSICSLVAAVGSCLVTLNFNLLLEWSSAGTFFLFSAICAATVVFVAKLVPETKGRSLEEIQTSLSRPMW